MTKCPRCEAEVAKQFKDWKYGVFTIRCFKCTCGNQFWEFLKEGKLQFIKSEHDGGLAGLL